MEIPKSSSPSFTKNFQQQQDQLDHYEIHPEDILKYPSGTESKSFIPQQQQSIDCNHQIQNNDDDDYDNNYNDIEMNIHSIMDFSNYYLMDFDPIEYLQQRFHWTNQDIQSFYQDTSFTFLSQQQYDHKDDNFKVKSERYKKQNSAKYTNQHYNDIYCNDNPPNSTQRRRRRQGQTKTVTNSAYYPPTSSMKQKSITQRRRLTTPKQSTRDDAICTILKSKILQSQKNINAYQLSIQRNVAMINTQYVTQQQPITTTEHQPQHNSLITTTNITTTTASIIPSRAKLQLIEWGIKILHPILMQYQSQHLVRSSILHWKRHTLIQQKEMQRREFVKYLGVLKLFQCVGYVIWRRKGKVFLDWAYYDNSSVQRERRRGRCDCNKDV